MQRLPCPRCGNADTLGTFCKTCLQELYPLVKERKEITVQICERCNKARAEGIWIPLERAIEKGLHHALSYVEGATITDIAWNPPDIEMKPGIRRTTPLHITVTGRLEDVPQEYEEEYDVPLTYLVTLCTNCRKQGTQYYEGILQMRNESDRVRQAIKTYLAAHAPKGLHLAKTVTNGGGTDYYLSSNRAVGHLARHLHREYGGELKVNAQHFSQDRHSGKILYRTNALLELPEYTKGDVIKRDGTPLLILGISTTVKAENLKTGGEEHFPYRRGEAVRLPVRIARVARTRPLEIFHPDTFQQVAPLRSAYAPAELEPGNEVSVAVDGDALFLIPYAEERPVERRKKRRVSQKQGSRNRNAE